jgi:Protein of unknown function (DUF3102)
MKQKNARSLDAIADDINRLKRANIFDIGDLLVEAKAQCEHGEWLDWLSAEFEWASVDTAERYMKVAKLSAQFRSVRNLKLAATTLYRLVDHEDEDELPAILKELTKHATKTRLKPVEANRVMQVGIGRHRFGNHPDATLEKLVDLDQHNHTSWYEGAVLALQERNPKTSEAADAIVDEIEQEAERILFETDEADADETNDILDGPPPTLPPPTPPEPQKISGTNWAEQEEFDETVREQLRLSTKPIERFVAGSLSCEQIDASIEFLTAISTAKKAKLTEKAA